MRYLSLSYKNQFSFTCPIFNAETTLSACMKLRDKVWAGQQPQVRKGCQACMTSGKCPAAKIADYYTNNASGPKNDAHGSAMPKKGKLTAFILEKVQRVIVMPRIMAQYGISENEERLINSARERIDAQMETAPSGEGERTVTFRGSNKPTKSKPMVSPKTTAPAPIINNAIAAAAMTGDLSAAINQ